jgi:hypothetical protein
MGGGRLGSVQGGECRCSRRRAVWYGSWHGLGMGAERRVRLVMATACGSSSGPDQGDAHHGARRRHRPLGDSDALRLARIDRPRARGDARGCRAAASRTRTLGSCERVAPRPRCAAAAKRSHLGGRRAPRFTRACPALRGILSSAILNPAPAAGGGGWLLASAVSTSSDRTCAAPATWRGPASLRRIEARPRRRRPRGPRRRASQCRQQRREVDVAFNDSDPGTRHRRGRTRCRRGG